ncbi:hypothetical protein [Ruegeria arenilitoris]|uniref:hypothetical protein n=1 Tax=Ruegeria arenilitoris TaxID=1173585 RepID=UPI001C2C901C|nr:hypothetical protein [Ruegeria arenilitoris]
MREDFLRRSSKFQIFGAKSDIGRKQDRLLARTLTPFVAGVEDHMPNDIWKICLISRTIGADRGRAARGRP